MTSDDVLIRPATDDDRAFISASWLRSYRASGFAERIPSDVYWSRWGHSGFVDAVLDGQFGLWPLVACLPSDPSFAYGFAAYALSYENRTLLHYLYVKQAYRRNGVGLQLLGEVGPRVVTHDTPAWRSFAAKHGIKFEYVHPYEKARHK